ncbi:CBS domain-containing protein [Spirochaeta isovalerica]|uniref:tRNA nucleotidyltransferase (CCA-adding enzyme) n=1 Tax=Spirochaeta isovalerica TaxID=150 RepID=A0A841RIP6_9SPIO|nr:CBS domain-containing protein [Spirochaeta isovalerica]MBB6482398.1 tRNA nucleotidyltransferase (CCA-adding enzyme) [Spirochaeta isovalerica]
MNILLGHTNMDLDCIGSIVMARYLYPDYVPVKSRLIHPVANNLYNLYQNHLGFINPIELENEQVDHVVVFDTRSRKRIREYFDRLGADWQGKIDIYDHHVNDSMDIPGAELNECVYGSNTSFICEKVMEKGSVIHPDDATIALCGIFADTGNFTHQNVCAQDFAAAAWLMEMGANKSIAMKFLSKLSEEYQVTLFHQVLNNITIRNIHGHSVAIVYMELESQVNGMAAVIEKAFEIEHCDAIFGIFCFCDSENSLIIGRSRKEKIDMVSILGDWGGGGHTRAGSALLKKRFGTTVKDEFLLHLESMLLPAIKARDLMTAEVLTINENKTVLECSLYLEEISHTGVPVENDAGQLCGMITLRDISKARKVDQMHSRIKGYMTKKVFSCHPDASVRKIESLFNQHHVGHLPVVDEEMKILGIVTRRDYLDFLENIKG